MARKILGHSLIPIIEPDVSIKSKSKAKAEITLREIARQLDALPEGTQVMLEVTISTVSNFYKPVITHNTVLPVVALSDGHGLADACEMLSHNHGLIVSFSRALTQELRVTMTDNVLDAKLGETIDRIYTASVVKL